ncbi:MAG: hypothetical protein OEV91_02585 [Desulfobulbaceae bacterium]|nr:hypothetical protein [Desulfobulbaceae bacterium]
MSKPQIAADITDQFTLDFVIPRMLENLLREIGAGVRVNIDIKKWRKPNTKPQRGYLWGVVYPTIVRYIKDCVGQDFTAEQLHEQAKKQYLGYEVCQIPGMEDLVKPRSSMDLDSEEFFRDLVEHVCREWAEKGLYIPLPKKKEDCG